MELSLKSDFRISKPRIAVLGLNRHAGDEGLIGDEENNIIKPVIADLKKQSTKLVFGPYPADGFFGSGQYQKFDGIRPCTTTGAGAIKYYIDFENGGTFTAGLPTSELAGPWHSLFHCGQEHC